MLALRARGEVVYRCTARGWEPVGPRASLHDRIETKQIGELQPGPRWLLYANEGLPESSADGIARGECRGADGFGLALYEVRAPAREGGLRRVRWVRRTETHGGVPTEGCTARDAGRMLAAEFRATYLFYTEE